jgi:hypothetical protein
MAYMIGCNQSIAVALDLRFQFSHRRLQCTWSPALTLLSAYEESRHGAGLGEPHID